MCVNILCLGLNDLYESLAYQFLALLWIVQKNKELKWSEKSCQKQKKREKNNKKKKYTVAVKKEHS